MMEQVADLSMTGSNPTQISKQTGIKRAVVVELLEDYRIALAQDTAARDMARDYLNQMVKHYDKVIKKLYETVDDIDDLNFNHQVAGQKVAALKAVAEIDAKRLDALQKAGLLDSAELGDELAEMEEQRDLLMEILREDLCSNCKPVVLRKLSQISGRAEVLDVEVVHDSE